MIQSLRTSRRLCGGGQIVPFYNWYDHLSEEGKKYGYLVNGSKSWLIVKSDLLADEEKRVFFTNGYKSKLTYYMHTIESFEDYVDLSKRRSTTYFSLVICVSSLL